MSDASIRVENLAGAFATTVGRAIDRAVTDAAGLGATEAAALIALGGFAHGGRQDILVAALDISQPGAARALERLPARRLLRPKRGRSSASPRAGCSAASAARAMRARPISS